jgi:ATP-dependent RNA helicase SUPV3L1/SUV3
LLAWEVCETLRNSNIKCNLLTGNEKDFYDCGGTHTSSTVEMVDLIGEYEVAVIDEGQLIGDLSRGKSPKLTAISIVSF